MIINERDVFIFTEAHSSAGYTVEEAIEKMGFGWFQVKLLALCGVAWVCFNDPAF